jgi:basic membrane protein A
MKRSILAVAVATACLAGTSVAQAHSNTTMKAKGKHFSIGLVVAFTKNDHGFNQRSIAGLKQAHNKLGAKTSYVVAYQESQFQSDLETYAQQKDNLVIANGFYFNNAIYHAAADYPKTHFAIVDGQPTNDQGKAVKLKNVSELLFREQDAGYLVGVIAGSVEKEGKGPAKHNTIGTLGGAQIPFVTGLMCGYYAGAKSVDKHVKLAWNYATSFTDPQQGKQYGETQISHGADILFQVADETGFGYLQAAKENNKYGIGFVSDESHLGHFMLTSAAIKVNVAVYLTAKAVQEGTFKGGHRTFGLKHDGVGYSKNMNHVSKKIRARVAKVEQQIKDGSIKVKATCTLPTSA